MHQMPGPYIRSMFRGFITDSCKNLMSNKLVVVSDVSNDRDKGILTKFPWITQLFISWLE